MCIFLIIPCQSMIILYAWLLCFICQLRYIGTLSMCHPRPPISCSAGTALGINGHHCHPFLGHLLLWNYCALLDHLALLYSNVSIKYREALLFPQSIMVHHPLRPVIWTVIMDQHRLSQLVAAECMSFCLILYSCTLYLGIQHVLNMAFNMQPMLMAQVCLHTPDHKSSYIHSFLWKLYCHIYHGILSMDLVSLTFLFFLW